MQLFLGGSRNIAAVARGVFCNAAVRIEQGEALAADFLLAVEHVQRDVSDLGDIGHAGIGVLGQRQIEHNRRVGVLIILRGNKVA